jgi:hypothetical protein
MEPKKLSLYCHLLIGCLPDKSSFILHSGRVKDPGVSLEKDHHLQSHYIHMAYLVHWLQILRDYQA